MASSLHESLFLRAIQVPPGPEREALLAAHCDGNESLRRSMESLLEAHDAVDGLPAAPHHGTTAPADPSPGRDPAATDPTALAAACLSDMDAGRIRDAALRLGGMDPGPRRETNERLEAALRARSLPVGAANSASAEPPDGPPPRVPGFRIGARLGSGGLGVVYAAHDEKLNRRVAVKVLRRADDTVRRRILEEARKAAALDDPAIVTIYSVLDEGDPPAIVMEFVEGFPVDRFAGRLNFQQKAQLLREVARGLSTAHAQGVLHRDLKPDNVIVGPEMRPTILDFGLALSLSEAGRAGRGFEGTPLYASPEQVLGRPLTAASDVFSFGSLMFKVLTGEPPFPGTTVAGVLEAIATTAPPFLRDVAIGVPEELQAIVLACLSWNPADRPTAAGLVLELGRFVAGEPVRLRPKLYDDLLRRRISEQSTEVAAWETQGIISREERDQLQVLHRRLLADEDHWIIDARRLTLAQTVLYTSTWIVVVAVVLLVWLARDDVAAPWRWLAPALGTLGLLAVGVVADRRREPLAAATFLAAAALSLGPSTLALLKELGWLGIAPPSVGQLFGEAFTNQQFLVACAASGLVSALGLARLRMTGFAWTTAAVGVAGYLAVLLTFGWLDWPMERRALACLPLVAAEVCALAFERAGRVRWSLPYHLVALVALIGSADVMASEGPTLAMLGIGPGGYLTLERLRAFSFALNGVVFLGLMFATERAPSLDLRRASRVLEIASLLHAEGALFHNAYDHHDDPRVRLDVFIHLAAAAVFLAVGAWRGRWRLLVGALGGLALGSYLVVDLGLVARVPFIFSLGVGGMVIATAAFLYLLRAPRASSRRSQARAKTQ